MKLNFEPGEDAADIEERSEFIPSNEFDPSEARGKILRLLWCCLLCNLCQIASQSEDISTIDDNTERYNRNVGQGF